MNRYKRIIDFLEKQKDNVGTLKNIYAEYSSINHKKQIYNGVQFNPKQQKEFDAYWIRTYGKKISNKWHRLYQGISGEFRVDYFPEHLFTIKLGKILNNRSYASVLSDKNLLPSLFSDIRGLHVPKSYISFVNGLIFDYSQKVISKREACNIFCNLDECVCKPTTDTGSGAGVIILDKNNINEINFNKIINKNTNNFVIQEKIKTIDILNKISPNCVSTIRVNTFITPDGVSHAPIAMRMGTGDSTIDNIHAGGLVVSVCDNGKLYPKAYRLGFGDVNEQFTSHPDSGIVFDDVVIDAIPRIIKTAYQCHLKIPKLGMISWDFTVDNLGCPVLIEANTRDISVWFPQMVSGKPFFGEYTEYFINMIRHN